VVYDLANLAVVCLIVAAMVRRRGTAVFVTGILLAHILLVFYTNDVLFPSRYFPDQFAYLDLTGRLRNLDFSSWASNFTTVRWSSLIFALSPVPFIVSVRSIALFNALLFCLLYFWLWGDGRLKRPASEAFFLFYPSLALYATLAHRDLPVLVFMVAGAYLLVVKKNVFLSILVMAPTLLLRKQAFFAFLTAAAVSRFISGNRKRNAWVLLAVSVVGVMGISIVGQIKLGSINYEGQKAHLENYPDLAGYKPYASGWEFLLATLKGTPRFMAMPLPWEARNVWQAIQAVEDGFILLAAVWLFSGIDPRKAREGARELVFVALFFLSGMLVHGALVINAGTAARHRFPFIVVLFVFGELFRRDRMPAPGSDLFLSRYRKFGEAPELPADRHLAPPIEMKIADSAPYRFLS